MFPVWRQQPETVPGCCRKSAYESQRQGPYGLEVDDPYVPLGARQSASGQQVVSRKPALPRFLKVSRLREEVAVWKIGAVPETAQQDLINLLTALDHIARL
jgi:hypothetical protein